MFRRALPFYHTCRRTVFFVCAPRFKLCLRDVQGGPAARQQEDGQAHDGTYMTVVGSVANSSCCSRRGLRLTLYARVPMQDEERGEGHISKEDIKRYLDALGSRWWFLGLFLASSVERVLYVGTGTSIA